MNESKFIRILDETSPTFCLAKFHEASIWVYLGKIASCHYTPFLQVGNTVDTFYNPLEKREQQKLMLEGKQPAACNSCWNFENLGLKSDRTRKSLAFKTHLPSEDYKNSNYVFKPKALELAFQNTCNLACSYCSPQFSTSWINDIKQHGIYQDILTDDRKHYQKELNEINAMAEPPDINLFWEWFETVVSDLESIRVTGGEPLMHEEVFRLFELVTDINPNVECVVHTNLCQKPLVISRFLDKISKLNNVRINVSNESAGEVAEFIRDGMNYKEWLDNLRKLSNSSIKFLTVSTTCSAISLQSLDELYIDVINLRKTTDIKPLISINMVDKPDFQGFGCLTYDEREFYIKKYSKFFDLIKTDLYEFEIEYFKNLIKMLKDGLIKSNQKELRRDSDIFFDQYTKRRNKNVNFAYFIGKK